MRLRKLSSLNYMVMALAILIVLDAVALTVAIRLSHKNILTRTTTVLEQSSISLEERMKRTIVSAEAVLELLSDRLETKGIGNKLRSIDQYSMLARTAQQLPDKAIIAIMDKNGDLILHSEEYPAPSVNNANREYFKAHKNGAKWHIGPVVQAKITKKYNFSISHRLKDKKGDFAGIVLAAIDTSDYTEFLQYLNIGKESSAVVLRNDGELILREPLQPEWIGKNFKDVQWFSLPASQQASGIYRQKITKDAPTRIVAYRQVQGYPLVAMTTVPVSSAFAEWRGKVILFSLISVAVLFALLGSAWLIRSSTKREDAEKERELQRTNQLLKKEIEERKRIEEELRKSRDELELRVKERTQELEDAYNELRNEMKRREQIEETLRQSQKMEAIGTLAGGIAHDFNNILAGVIGFGELIEEDMPTESQGAQQIKRLLGAAYRGKDLVRKILTFSRKSEVKRQVIRLTPLLEETVQLLRYAIPTTIEIYNEMKATHDNVLASPSEVQQILMNLGTNASSAMKDNGGLLHITTTNILIKKDMDGIKQGKYIELRITDTGTGISPEVMERIFDPFFTTKGNEGGTGLGLSIVYGIVKDLGGNIKVDSQLGKGSTFKVMLPVADKPEA